MPRKNVLLSAKGIYLFIYFAAYKSKLEPYFSVKIILNEVIG